MNSKSKNVSSRQNAADGGKKHIPKYIEADLEYLESAFQMGGKLDTSIYRLFNEHANSYWFALDLMSNTKDFSRGRSWSLSRAIMEAFALWSHENNVAWQLTRESKVRALYTVLKQPNGSLVELVCDIFKMKEDSDFFKQFVEQFIAEKKFREVYYTITSLNLQREFSLSQVALPFFFLDKESWLRSYLSKFPELQLQLVTTLDSVSMNSQNIMDLVKSLNIESIVKKHVYDTSWLQRRIAHFIDIFNIDITECPNLYYSRSAGAMNYLIRKKYIEETISSEPWEELITSIVADKPSLQNELITRIVCLNDCEMALKLARKFNINENEWPSSLYSFYYASINAPEDRMRSSIAEKHYLDKKLSYLPMRLDMSDIHIVDDKEKFVHAIADISENYDIIGVDAEWKPNLGISKERIALLQLAVWDAVYLVDILALKVCLKRDSWEYMMKSIFYNPNILKLGYGVHNDLRLLTVISGDDKMQKYSRVVDAGDFFTKVKKLHPSIVDHITDVQESRDTHTEEHKGLSQLCLTLLGKPLNKDEQFSDWERRPLREEQIRYAALDAFCLLLIYEELFHILKKMELNFDSIVDIPFSPNSSSEKKKEKSPKKIQREPSQITDFKVVVDSMLHGLGKYLRVCGADVVILRNDEDHMNSLKIAQADGRVILTSGTPYKKLRGYMPEGMCFYVPDTMPAKEQASFVLKNFNIQLSEADIFSRCTVCNGNHYLKVPSDDLHALWSKLTPSQENSTVKKQSVELESKPFFSYEDGFITENGILHTAIAVQLHYLSPQVFQRIALFFICSKCGKVYWEGSHFGRIKTYISNFVSLSKDSRSSIYKVLSEENCKDSPNDQTTDPVPGCSLPEATKESNTRTDDATQDSVTECIDESSIFKQKKTTMQFALETSDHSASDYDSDDLVYCD